MAPKTVQRKSSNTGIRNIITRYNVVMLIMVSVCVLQLVSLILSLTSEGSRANIEAIFTGKAAKQFKIRTGRNIEEPADDSQLAEWVIVCLSSVMLFIVGSLHMLNMIVLEHKGMHIFSTLLLLVVACLVCAYLIKSRNNFSGEPSMLQDVPLNIVRANAILSLVFSVIQFLDILRP